MQLVPHLCADADPGSVDGKQRARVAHAWCTKARASPGMALISARRSYLLLEASDALVLPMCAGALEAEGSWSGVGDQSF